MTIIGFVFCVSPVLAGNVVDRIVAVVNGEVITLFELNQRFRPVVEQFQGRELQDEERRALLDGKRQLLDRMVEEVLMRQEAERLEMQVTDLEVQTQIRQIREQLGASESQFLEYLTLQGLTKDQYERRLREEMLRHRLLGFMIRRKVVVTSDEIRAYYENNKDDFAQQRQVRLGLILFASHAEAEEVQARLNAGTITFSDAAREYSRGPGAEQGGDMGLLAWRDLAADWRSALQPLRKGEISSIIRIQDRAAILKLMDEEPGEIKPLAAVEDQIREILMEPRLEERYENYMAGLRNRALIDIRL
ncbi:periplasmic chaperone for outer membrane proteins SurA [Desulfonatronum thiosulfatophilum]|uniref:Periplasmic chaperone for outer membrane proteins SurA n=1 Tax=Desulfonatronum thiosulfatophilum TaxID=617002 RepID=A0A1G6DRV8_9BACT|nr:SurA N-terminal domain-containing protein [Desulfonatronum thiosulfatophilum]SDB47830.1 periplasmic chaperone for outer membrane proteins SurA [Desulfonatronum thiosulfatophilum]